jgi:DNA-binding transcriptional MerR regulator
MTAGRTYLSIGDVLTLLRQEFPDVTISKIRFLESQGLVNPERTPSGYRKFYDHDVERLKWVLRQQREHFLPLKVIKGRLEDVGTDEASGVAEDESGELAENGSHLVEATKGVGSRAVGSGGGTATRNGGAAKPASAISERTPLARDLPSQLAGFNPSRLHAAARATGAAPSGAKPKAEPSGVLPLGEPEVTPGSGLAEPGEREHDEHDEPRGNGEHRQKPAGDVGDRSSEKDKVPSPRTVVPAVLPAGLGSRRFTAAEIAAASGLSEAEVSDLVSFGILGGRTVGGIVHYDESDLAVAELAAAFGRFGIEPRHLRLYKHSSDREAGFVEQLVLPLLKQRNPDARKRAAEMATELTRLGQGLRAALVQRSLQDLLG